MGFALIDLAMLSALGGDTESIRKNLFSDNNTDTLTYSNEFLLSESCYVGKIKNIFNPLPNQFREIDSQFTRIVCHLYQGIEKSVSALRSKFGRDRIAIILGSSTSGIDSSETPFKEREKTGVFPKDYFFKNQELGAGSILLAKLAGVTGPAYTISTACSSSAKVFQSAKNLLALDLADAVILGGVDSLCGMTVRGFKSLDLISDKKSNPMSKNRDGLNIGEGGALFVMVRSEKGIQVAGVGETSDAHHISAPDPSGAGATSAMEIAIAESGLFASDVSYLNLHGTGTVLNDAMESQAISKIPSLANVKCSSTKPLTGHLLGASGAFEIGLCWLSLTTAGAKKKLIKHHWDRQVDDTIPRLNLLEENEEISLTKDNLFLSNSFGFGGSNCCVAVRCMDELAA